MSRIDVKLDENTHDMVVEGYTVPFVGGKTAKERVAYYRQKLKIRLWFFLTEWFLDTGEGTPIYEDILVKDPNVPLINTLIKARILETEGVTELASYESDFDSAQRRFTVNFQAKTDAGLAELEVTIP